jgi:SAM-dependent methyltransferase
MPDQFFKGLQTLLPEYPVDKVINILSIGCGAGGAIATECNALQRHFLMNTFTYTGIDILPTPKNLDIFRQSGVSVSYIQADATNIQNLIDCYHLLPNSFDLVILRHPNFIDENEHIFKVILRETIPHFLITSGTLLVSVYHETETIFFGKEKKMSANTYFLNKLYLAKGERQHEENDTRSILLGETMSASDRWMFCFINKVNKTELTPKKYTIKNLNEKAIPYLERIILGLGGKFITFPNQFECAEEYELDTDHAIASYGKLTLMPSVQLGQPLLSSDSPLMSIIPRIKQELIPFKASSTEPFFKAFNSQQYNRALRIACTSNSTEALAIVSILVRYTNTLNLNPNEMAGDPSRNAFGLAKMKGGTEIYDLLCRICEDESVLPKIMSATK